MTDYPPKYPKFKLLDLKDRELFDKFQKKYPPVSGELTFANSFLWRRFDHAEFSLVHGNLCLLLKPINEPAFFLPPLGENQVKETLEICLRDAPRLSRVPEWFVKKYCGHLRAEPDRDNFDYVYLARDLAELKGKKYDGKRNRIRKFTRLHPYQYARLTAERLKGCGALFEEWIKGKSAQRTIWEELLKNYEGLNLTGGTIISGDKIVAVTIGEKLNEETAIIYFEIAYPGYEGLAQLMNQEFVKNEWADLKYINREQDMGIAGLRTAKLSYHPHHFVKKFNVYAE
ncbi:MAG: phosphatidylglycerol lysyltransferase domain-containing protein [Candidatus Margulisiibacteriota bacterium]